jgi:hypothetical protein
LIPEVVFGKHAVGGIRGIGVGPDDVLTLIFHH